MLAGTGAEAQSAAKAYRVGYLTYATREQVAPLLRAFTEGLRKLDYVEGRDIIVEQHYGDGTLTGLPDLAAAVVRSRVDVIVTGTNPIAAAAKRATATIPIVIVGTFDPVGAGLVANLARAPAEMSRGSRSMPGTNSSARTSACWARSRRDCHASAFFGRRAIRARTSRRRHED